MTAEQQRGVACLYAKAVTAWPEANRPALWRVCRKLAAGDWPGVQVAINPDGYAFVSYTGALRPVPGALLLEGPQVLEAITAVEEERDPNPIRARERNATYVAAHVLPEEPEPLPDLDPMDADTVAAHLRATWPGLHPDARRVALAITAGRPVAIQDLGDGRAVASAEPPWKQGELVAQLLIGADQVLAALHS